MEPFDTTPITPEAYDLELDADALLLGPGDYDVAATPTDEDLLPAYEDGDGAAIGSVWDSLPSDVTPLVDTLDFEVSPAVEAGEFSESVRPPRPFVDSVFEGGFRGSPQSGRYQPFQDLRQRPCAGQDRKRTARILQFRVFWEQTGESFPVQP